MDKFQRNLLANAIELESEDAAALSHKLSSLTLLAQAELETRANVTGSRAVELALQMAAAADEGVQEWVIELGMKKANSIQRKSLKQATVKLTAHARKQLLDLKGDQLIRGFVDQFIAQREAHNRKAAEYRRGITRR